MMIPAEKDLNNASLGLRAIAHPLRLAILCRLIDKPLNVGELTELSGVSQPVLSQHLAKLRMLNIVSCERRGQNVFYQLANPAYAAIIEAIKAVYCPQGLPDKENQS